MIITRGSSHSGRSAYGPKPTLALWTEGPSQKAYLRLRKLMSWDLCYKKAGEGMLRMFMAVPRTDNSGMMLGWG